MGIGVGLKTAAALQQKRSTATPDHDVEGALSHALTPILTTMSSNADTNSPGLIRTGSYGSMSTDTPGRGSLRPSPERLRRESSLPLDRVPEDSTLHFDHAESSGYSDATLSDEEEAEDELDEELEDQGLYRGSYRRLLALYTLVPLTSLVAFVCGAVLPSVAYPSRPSAYPYAPFFPFPVPEFLLSAALWCLAYLLRDPLYSLISAIASYLPFIPTAIPILVSTGLHTLLSLLLQQSALPLLLIPHYAFSNHPTTSNPAFKRVWWIALGWAAAEAAVAIKKGYEAIALYRDVLVTARRNDSEAGVKPDLRTSGSGAYTPATTRDSVPPSTDDLLRMQSREGDERQPLLSGFGSPRANGIKCPIEDALKIQVDQDIDELIALRNREELEEMYGAPVIRIPVFISCLQRVNSILTSLGVCLLLSYAYMCSTAVVSFSSDGQQQGATNTPLLITLPVVAALQFGLAVLHTPLVLPVLGVPTVVYTCSLVSLGSLFAGLGVWEGLV